MKKDVWVSGGQLCMLVRRVLLFHEHTLHLNQRASITTTELFKTVSKRLSENPVSVSCSTPYHFLLMNKLAQTLT